MLGTRRLPGAARPRRRRLGGVRARRPRCCTRSTTRVFKALLFLGAGAFERAVGSLELDRLGGLLRRMPWTGGAFLVGAMAIAGLPPLNGFASEWLTLQALLHVPAYGGVGDGIAGAIALAALAATAALAVFCFVKVVGLVLLGPPRREAVAARGGARRCRCAPASSLLAACCVVLGVAPGLLFGSLVGLAPWSAAAPTHGRPRPAGHRLAADGRDRARARRAHRRARRCCADAASPRPRRPGPAASSSSRRSTGRARASRSRCGSCSRPCCGRSARSPCAAEGGVVQEVSYSGRVPHLIDERLYRPVTAPGARRARATRGACRAAASAPTSPT